MVRKATDLILFPFYFVVARIVRLLFSIFDEKGPTKAAFIACYRDRTDVRKFGYRNIDDTPDVLSWVRYNWEGVKGRLFMIGSITEQLAGELATEDTKAVGRKQFIEAANKAIDLGAETILLAAGGTKRLFSREELQRHFSQFNGRDDVSIEGNKKVIFGLGDNFTGLLLGMMIMDAFKRSAINPRESRCLIIGPYGFLGGIALHYLIEAGCEIVGLGSPKRRNLLESLASQHNFTAAYTFDDVGQVDMVVACNSAPIFQLGPANIDNIRRSGKKIIVIDPNEPHNMSPGSVKKCRAKVIRYDAGNGYSSRLKYILGPFSYKLLRMQKGVTWGCFCENFILTRHPELWFTNWFEISPENITKISKFYGDKEGQFTLPPPTCHNKPIKDFSLAAANC